MFKQLIPGTMIAALVLAPALSAKDAPAPAAPPEVAQVAFFAGTWNCTGKTFASPMGPEHATAATVHGTMAVGGMWMNIAYDEKKTAANPTPYHAGIYMGFDAGAKKFVEGCFDNFGGYCTQSGSGWNGDTMTFEGTSNSGGKQFGARDTFTKKGANQVTHTGEMQGDDKQWIKTDEETCHKGK
ncbi:MAG TPA: DUF1579 family protein [Rudaea sp.]|nr:DUF1579 family protein [Rudaea sp.]